MRYVLRGFHTSRLSCVEAGLDLECRSNKTMEMSHTEVSAGSSKLAVVRQTTAV
jgi:hypothetical protein